MEGTLLTFIIHCLQCLGQTQFIVDVMDGVPVSQFHPFFFKTPGMGFSPIRSAAEPLFSEEVIGDCWWKEKDGGNK